MRWHTLTTRLALLLTVTLGTGCMTAAGPGDADRTVTVRETAKGLEGSWSRADDAQALLGVGGGKECPPSVAFAIDDRPGAKWAAEEWKETQAELARLRLRPAATARVRMGDAPAREWVIAYGDGATYACFVVPNAGLLANQLFLIPGATPDRDLLFVEWDRPDGGQGPRVVSAYRRS